MSVVGPALASVLRAERNRLNALYATARTAYPQLDADAFRGFLHAVVDPLATEVARVQADALATTVCSAYEVGLELTGKRVLEAGCPIAEGLATLAVPAAGHIAAQPQRVLAALANALVQLAQAPGARPADWVSFQAGIAARCPDAATFLQAGLVHGWRSGLAHYRASALTIADALPPQLAVAAVGSQGDWAALRERLARDPWFAPDGRPVPRVARVGAFRGYGGLFTRPPTVQARGPYLVVTSGDDAWLLTADAYGATFHRATPAEREAPAPHPSPDVTSQGNTLVVRGRTLALPVCGAITSLAEQAGTVVVTEALAHGVLVVPASEAA